MSFEIFDNDIYQEPQESEPINAHDPIPFYLGQKPDGKFVTLGVCRTPEEAREAAKKVGCSKVLYRKEVKINTPTSPSEQREAKLIEKHRKNQPEDIRKHRKQ